MTTTQMIRKPSGGRAYAEINPTTGDPQVFPFTEGDSRILAEQPDSELGQMVREHRDAYQNGHTTNCPGNLRRGLCH